MKTLIVYTSKRGATREIAERIGKQLGNAELCDLGREPLPDLAVFNTVIIGSPVYAGMANGKIKKFISENMGKLQGKRVGLFLSGLTKGEEDERKLFTGNFPLELLKAARAQMLLGGIFDPKKAGIMERLIIKAIMKNGAYIDAVRDDKIAEFVKLMQK
jgi:menaquinone-dependent protoporphyrinogen oxidase